MRLRLIATLLFACMAGVACHRDDGAHQGAGEPAALSDRVRVLLQRADYAAVADLLHQPPSYGAAELTRERRAATELLTYLFAEFGIPDKMRPAEPQVVFFKISVAGASVPYWNSLPNFGVDATVTYRAQFAKVGPGILNVTFIRRNQEWGLRAVEPGLLVTEPQARDAIVRIGRGALRKMNPGIDDATLTRILDEWFPPAPPQQRDLRADRDCGHV